MRFNLRVNIVMGDEEERKLFRQYIGDVEPLPGADNVRHPLPGAVSLSAAARLLPGTRARRCSAQGGLTKGGNFLADPENIKRVTPWEIVGFKRDGVQHGVFRNLRLGKYAIDATLDLHRLSVPQAREQVFRFVGECVARDVRCGMITHGRGEQRAEPALLKSCVNHWLRELDNVLAFHSANRQHGGSGSTYLLLRKGDAAKEKNRQRFNPGRP